MGSQRRSAQDSATRTGTRGHPADRPIQWRFALVAAAAGAIAFLASHLLASTPTFAERAYGTGLWPLVSRPISRLTGAFPFAIAEWIVAVYATYLMVLGGRAALGAIRARRSWRNALAGGARRLVRDAGVLIVVFYLLWGFNYARPTFEDRAGWPGWQGIEAPELTRLAEAAVLAANDAYVALHGTEDAGTPTPFPADARALEAALDTGWQRATVHLGLPHAAARAFGPVKWPFASALLGRLGIVGIYVPFTGEANVLRDMPAIRAPASMAHEMAHQRGVTTEAEATFLGLIAAALAPDSLARYSAVVSVAGQLASALRSTAPDEFERISARLLPGIRRDEADLRAYFQRFEGPAQRVGGAINDRYLRANRVPGGTANYGRSVRLLITWSRLHSGAVLPDSP
jgi:hypothetical protein